MSDEDFKKFREYQQKMYDQMYARYYGGNFWRDSDPYEDACDEAEEDLKQFTKKKKCYYPQAVMEAKYKATMKFRVYSPEQRKDLSGEKKAEIIEFLVQAYIETVKLIDKAQFNSL